MCNITWHDCSSFCKVGGSTVPLDVIVAAVIFVDIAVVAEIIADVADGRDVRCRASVGYKVMREKLA